MKKFIKNVDSFMALLISLWMFVVMVAALCYQLQSAWPAIICCGIAAVATLCIAVLRMET